MSVRADAPLSQEQIRARLQVLAEIEPIAMSAMAHHEARRPLWLAADLMAPADDVDPYQWTESLRERARGIPDAARLMLALNLLTEEGLPHFHRILSVLLGEDGFWQQWNNLWTAEEDRHGNVLRDYCREARLLDMRRLEEMQFHYLRCGFFPAHARDPYRTFVYTTLQERATQIAHAHTRDLVADHEPCLARILGAIAGEEARHFAFYRGVFTEILARDPSNALVAAARIMTGMTMPGASIPGFADLSDIASRLGVYGPREHVTVIEEQIESWGIASLCGLDPDGERARDVVMALPGKLRRTAEFIESRRRPRSWRFPLLHDREIEI
jgi:acyl-[acyl-carrier-protein] desaturase